MATIVFFVTFFVIGLFAGIIITSIIYEKTISKIKKDHELFSEDMIENILIASRAARRIRDLSVGYIENVGKRCDHAL